MSEKATRLGDTERAFTELQGTIEGLSDEEMRAVWLGSWGVREILIHISGWHDEMIAAFGRIGQGQPPYPAGTYDDFDAWNARFVDRRAGVKFLTAAAELPEALFAPGGAARDPLEGAGAGHYREHAAQIRQWRAR